MGSSGGCDPETRVVWLDKAAGYRLDGSGHAVLLDVDGGGWVVGPVGTLLATSGVSTLIGCDNVPVGDWLSSARRAGFDGATLVLLDQHATELGRLHRDNGGPGTTTPASGN